MVAAPINVKAGAPSAPPNGWQTEASQWKHLNQTPIDGKIGNPGFLPLTVKFGYVFGVIYNIWESVACLLRDKDFAKDSSYLPAYGIFISGVELLGRCLTGPNQAVFSTLIQGLKWLKTPNYPGFQQVQKTDVLA